MTELRALYQIADKEGIEVDCFELNSREAISYMDEEGGCYIAIDPFKLRSVAEERSKLAHELGHCVTGSFYNQYAACDLRRRHENRADRWAVERLISRDEFEAAVKSGKTEVWELAEWFGVTESFMKKAICFYKFGNLAVELYF